MAKLARPLKSAPVVPFAAREPYPARRPALHDGETAMARIRGLSVMLIGAVLIGYGTGSLPLEISAVFSGLFMLLFGFTYLMA